MSNTISGTPSETVTKFEAIQYCHHRFDDIIFSQPTSTMGRDFYNQLIQDLTNDTIDPTDLPSHGISDQLL